MMALGDKKYVGLVEDWGQPNSPATLDENGILTPAQWPTLDDLGAADRVLSNLTDPAQAIYNLGAKPGENLLDNWYFADPVDQRGGYVVPPDTPYYSDTGLTTQVGTTASYATATNVDGVYGKITVSSTTYYVDWTAAVRGYVGKGIKIDRWDSNVADCYMLIEDDGIVFGAPSTDTWYRSFVGTFSERWAKQHTLSLLTVDGKIHSHTAKFSTGSGVGETVDSPVVDGIRLRWQKFDNNNVAYVFYISKGYAIKIKAAKLELGDHQTLARQDADGNWVLLDPPPNRDLELLKCITSTADPSDTYANKVIATRSDLANYLPLTGGTLTGENIYMASGKGHLFCNINQIYMGTSHNGMTTGTHRTLTLFNSGYVSSIADCLRIYDFVDGDQSKAGGYTVLHTGNKPNGSYTGNGDATKRTIETGGIGSVIAIYSNSGKAFICYAGGICASGTTVSNHFVNEVQFLNGVLTIASTNQSLNQSGTTYYYQVL